MHYTMVQRKEDGERLQIYTGDLWERGQMGTSLEAKHPQE